MSSAGPQNRVACGLTPGTKFPRLSAHLNDHYGPAEAVGAYDVYVRKDP